MTLPVRGRSKQQIDADELDRQLFGLADRCESRGFKETARALFASRGELLRAMHPDDVYGKV